MKDPLIHTLAAALSVASLSLSVPASAAPQIFFGEDLSNGYPILNSHPHSDAAHSDFVDAIAGYQYGYDDLESYAAGSRTPGTMALDFGNLGTLTLSGGYMVNAAAGSASSFPFSGTHYWETNGSQNAQSLSQSFSFSQPVSGFGFYGSDFNDYTNPGSPTLATVYFADGTTSAYTIGSTSSPNGSALFWGFLSPDAQITGVTFADTLNRGDDWLGFDNFYVVGAPLSAVPEPGTLALFSLGLAGLAATRLRRRPRKG
ncbi:MAG: PEP-CTERM sorting domain-containing protein [Zoogloeaceae bacterium]|jgi:hypothetical protein|nr:PEP-CTERM sorting domain-containing protein [Zoogloeaceae bacterium]